MNTPASTASAITEAQIDAYLAAQRRRVQEADGAWGRGLKCAPHLHPVRDACRAGLEAAFALAAPTAQTTGQEARHLARAYAVWNAVHFSDADPEPLINATRFHDLLGLEAGADQWTDSAFFESAPVEQPTGQAKAALARVTQALKDGDTLGASLALVQVEKLIDQCAAVEPSQPVASAIGDIAQVLCGLLDEEEWTEMEQKIATVCAALEMPASRTPAPAVPDWQPIETAPIENDPVLAFNRNGRISLETSCFLRNMMNAAKVDNEACFYTHWARVPRPPVLTMKASGGTTP